jgi:hypothetical protein
VRPLAQSDAHDLPGSVDEGIPGIDEHDRREGVSKALDADRQREGRERLSAIPAMRRGRAPLGLEVITSTPIAERAKSTPTRPAWREDVRTRRRLLIPSEDQRSPRGGLSESDLLCAALLPNEG